MNTSRATLLLILASATLASAGLITVNPPSGFLQSSSYATDPLAADFSAPNSISIGPADNPFNRGVSTASSISTAFSTAVAASSASQDSRFVVAGDRFDLTSSGAVGGSGSITPYIARAHAIADSRYALSFLLSEPFSFTLSATAAFGNSSPSGGAVDVGLYGPFGVTIALIAIDPAYPGAPSTATFSGTLPAGAYDFVTFLNVQVDAYNAIDNVSGFASYTAAFHAVPLVPEPTTAWFGAIGLLGVALRRTRRGAHASRGKFLPSRQNEL